MIQIPLNNPRPPPMRTTEQLEQDGLLDIDHSCRSSPEFHSKRYAAVLEVLKSLPQADYDRFKAKASSIEWFLPDGHLWGRCSHYQDKIVIYLAAFLEGMEPRRSKEIAAHEIAHIVLGHEFKTLPKTGTTGKRETCFVGILISNRS